MLELEFRHDHSIRSKCLKWVVRKILPTLQKMHIYCKRCNKHTGNTFPKKIILVSENEIKGKSRCAICFTEKTFIDDIKKNSFKGIDIYYINYIQENINSSNPLRIKINSATGYFKEKNDEKYLILDSTKEYESVWSEIRSEIKRINGGEKVFYEKNYCKIGINTKDDLFLKESLKFLALIVNINLTIQVDNKLYPQIYLDEYFYEL